MRSRGRREIDGLFVTIRCCRSRAPRTTYWKTGHSYMKRRTMNALAGLRKSGHFFFNAPLGRGYDGRSDLGDCDPRDARSCARQSMADLKDALPKTWSSPTMSRIAPTEAKYGIVDSVVKHFEAMRTRARRSRDNRSADLVPSTACASRSGWSWGLVRASSTSRNWWCGREAPCPAAHSRLFEAMNGGAAHPSEVGEYNQKI